MRFMTGDLREAFRQLRKTPGITTTAVITLTLGIGATTAIFTLVHQVMLRSLPVTRPDELWRIGDQVRCCNWGGYTQGDDGDFALFSWEAYNRATGWQCPARSPQSGIAGAGGHAQWPVCVRQFLPHSWHSALDRPPDDRRRRP
jgi:hypothetical protein